MGEVTSDDGRRPALQSLPGQEDSVLIEARFEPTENRLVWKKHGLWFGREAALQAAFLERRERDR